MGAAVAASTGEMLHACGALSSNAAVRSGGGRCCGGGEVTAEPRGTGNIAGEGCSEGYAEGMLDERRELPGEGSKLVPSGGVEDDGTRETSEPCEVNGCPGGKAAKWGACGVKCIISCALCDIGCGMRCM